MTKLLRSLSLQVVVALAAGIAVGALIQGGDAIWVKGAEAVEALGALWLNCLRMTVVPLVFALLVTGIASVTDAAATGKLAARALAWFAVLVLCAAVYGIAGTELFLGLWPLDADGAAALVGAPTAPRPIPPAPSFGEWVKALAPANPIKAAAEDAILPLVVFAVFVGFAASRLSDELAQAADHPVFRRLRGDDHHRALGAAGRAVRGLRAGSRRGPARRLRARRASWPLRHPGFDRHRRHHPGGLRPGAGFRRRQAGGLRRARPRRCRPWPSAPSRRWPACRPWSSGRGMPLAIPNRVTGLVLPLAVAVFRMTSPVANLAVALFVCTGLRRRAKPGRRLLGAVFVAFAISVGVGGTARTGILHRQHRADLPGARRCRWTSCPSCWPWR